MHDEWAIMASNAGGPFGFSENRPVVQPLSSRVAELGRWTCRNMKRSITLVSLMLFVLASAAYGAEGTNASSISVQFVSKRGGKPPMRFFYVSLSATNTHKHVTWFITRYWGDHPLATNAPFKAISPWKTGYVIHNAYSGDSFGGKGKFRTTRFIGASPKGEQQHSFEAFLLPAGGMLRHDFFNVEAWADISHLEIWEATQLLVNGKTPLEDWLPYEVVSSAETHITQKSTWEPVGKGAFQWKTGKGSSDYPTEQVLSIVPTVIYRHDIPIEGLPEKEKSN